MNEILDKILPYYEARAEFCQIFRSFFGQWSFTKKCFWDLLTFNRNKSTLNTKFIIWLIVYFVFISDVLVLNDIINQTAAVSELRISEPSTELGHELVIVKQPRNSLQSAGSALSDGAVGSDGEKRAARKNSESRGMRSTTMKLERARRESRKISMMLDDEEDEGPRLKERITEGCQSFVDIFCVWDCCWVYIKLSEVRKDRWLFWCQQDIFHKDQWAVLATRQVMIR